MCAKAPRHNPNDGLSTTTPARSSRPGSARLGRQKDGLPIPLLVPSISVQGHRRAHDDLGLRRCVGTKPACRRSTVFTSPVLGCAMQEPNWTQVTTTVKGKKIEGEYCREGHLIRVRHGNREKGGDPGNSGLEATARDLLRELAEDGAA